MPRMTNRRKGAEGEHLGRRIMLDITGEAWRRTVQHKSAGVVGDIEPIDTQSDWNLAHVEVKNVDKMGLGNTLWSNALVQAVRDCPAGKFVVLLWRVTPRQWAVTLWDAQAECWATYTQDEAKYPLGRKLAWAVNRRDAA